MLANHYVKLFDHWSKRVTLKWTACVVVMTLVFQLVPNSDTAVAQTQKPQLQAPGVQNPQSPTITTETLKFEISRAIEKVEEFEFIRNQADRLGVKVYLFGGTAAAFAHYVKWDYLRREHLDQSFFPDRFDFKYVNIYRSNQDLDIVVDGPASAIQELQTELASHFPYLQGSKGQKSSWEVRSLNETVNGKFALLKNNDFLNQHTDSNSVGMIEITRNANPKEIVRDLRQWNEVNSPNFLQDVAEGKIHFYFSPKHSQTQYAVAGRNPPILSVIRYFIKVFQFNLKMRDEDLPVLKTIISEFNPQIMITQGDREYLKSWFTNNVPKLIQNSIDVEYAMNILAEVDLLPKLREIDPDPKIIDSVSWWMHKKPLPSFPLGEGRNAGQTAAELGIEVVAHETTSFSVYEAITRSHQGIPNVLESRKGVSGEAAAHGNGFYTMRGKNSGFRGSGFTIRFKVHPEARERVDFDLADRGQIIIFHNRRALTVIPENLKLNLIGYYNLLTSAEKPSPHDLGVFHRLRLALRSHFHNPTEEELGYLQELSGKELIILLQRDFTPESIHFLLNGLTKITLAPHEVVDTLKEIQRFVLNLTYSDSTALRKELVPLLPLLRKNFLMAEPTSLQMADAIKLELFKNADQDLLSHLLKSAHGGDEILAVLDAWSKNKSQIIPLSAANLRTLLARLGQKFYSFHPNHQDILRFRDLLPLPPLQIALAAYHFDEPTTLMAGLGTGALTPKTTAQSVRVWNKVKSRFYQLQPSLTELIDSASAIGIPEIQIELLDYAKKQNFFRRRNDIISFVKVLTPILSHDTELSAHRDQLLGELLDQLKALRPTTAELGVFFASPGLGRQIKKRLLEFQPIKLKGADDLLSWLQTLSRQEERNNFVENNLELIQQIQFDAKNLTTFTQLLDHRLGSHLILQTFLEQNPDNIKPIHDLLMAEASQWQSPEHQSPLLKELWAKVVHWACHLLSKDEAYFTELLLTIPFTETYEIYLRERISTLKQLSDLFSMSTFAHLRRKALPSEAQVLSKLTADPITYQRTLNIMIETLKQEMPRLSSLGAAQVDIIEMSEFLAQYPDDTFPIEILNMALKIGLTVKANDQLRYAPGVPNNWWNRDWQKYLFLDLYSLYIITHADILTSKHNRNFGVSLYSNLIQMAFNPDRLSSITELSHQDFASEAFRLYLLSGARELLKQEPEVGDYKTKEEALNNLIWFNPGWSNHPLGPKLKAITSELNGPLREHLNALYKQNGSLLRQGLLAFHSTRPLQFYEQDLEKQWAESLARWQKLMELHPEILKPLEFLQEPQPGQCQKALQSK